MKSLLLNLLCCPDCQADLTLTQAEYRDAEIVSGQLVCGNCQTHFPVRAGVPRFVTSEQYADSFGVQWNAFPRVQHDSTMLRESHDRFESETGLRHEDLIGKVVLEVGSGNGRFIDVVSACQAKLVVGVDLSSAVDAAQATLGQRPNVTFVQADVFRLPFKPGLFDIAYSIGVLHHTPHPQRAWEAIVPFVKPGGRQCVSLYDLVMQARNSEEGVKVAAVGVGWALNIFRAELFRSIITRLPRRWFLQYCLHVVPVLHRLNKIPVLRYLRYLFPATCYRHLPVEWSILDTYDTYATRIVHRFSARQVFQWYKAAGFRQIEIQNSRVGWTSVTGLRPESAN
jgi:uncharacterized protein YbaR (Trm112 family)/ubiquinone/menaquinone biosynthesis C-methylase UbiE